MLTCKTCGEAIAMSGIHRCPGFQKPTPDPLRAALVAIQELHGRDTYGCCLHCLSDDGWSVKFPCPSRRLADDALTGRTTKNGGA